MNDDFDVSDHHEKIREKINIIVNESIESNGATVNEALRHLLVNVCKIMYDKGVRDGHRICQKVIEVSMDVYKE